MGEVPWLVENTSGSGESVSMAIAVPGGLLLTLMRNSPRAPDRGLAMALVSWRMGYPHSKIVDWIHRTFKVTE